MTTLHTSFPVHMLQVYPNIRPAKKVIKTEDLSGLYLDFVLADISNLFEEVILVHDASLRPAMITTVPSTLKWNPRNNTDQGEMAIKATGVRFSDDDDKTDLLGRIKKVVLEKIGPECTVVIYEK